MGGGVYLCCQMSIITILKFSVILGLQNIISFLTYVVPFVSGSGVARAWGEGDQLPGHRMCWTFYSILFNIESSLQIRYDSKEMKAIHYSLDFFSKHVCRFNAFQWIYSSAMITAFYLYHIFWRNKGRFLIPSHFLLVCLLVSWRKKNNVFVAMIVSDIYNFLCIKGENTFHDTENNK